jgi:hypothetical protein
MNYKAVINAIIAVTRSFLRNQAVVDAIKKAALEAATRTDWGEGEKTLFVIEAGRSVVTATPTPIDDFLYDILAKLYIAKYVKLPADE